MLAFVEYVYSEYKAQHYHKILCHKLDLFERRIIKNLMVFIPPQHGKSELTSRKLPPYLLGRNPNAKIVAASYGSDLIQGMNRDAQRTIESPEYQKLFPNTQLNSSNIRTVSGSYLRNSDEFEIVGHRGKYKCSGVGGPLTGQPADFALIDDPIKDYKEAMSETIRSAVWEWYTSVLLTRTHSGTGKLLTMTRWHPEDLAGKLLALEPDEWEVLRLPAICEDPNAPDEYRQIGEALWEEKFPAEMLLKRKPLNVRQFEALYQQNPRAREGGMFQRGWFKIVKAIPTGAKKLRYWDKAGTDGGNGARTAGVKLFIHEGNLYIENVIKGRWSSNLREQTIKQTALLDGVDVTVWIEQEPGSGRKGISRKYYKESRRV